MYSVVDLNNYSTGLVLSGGGVKGMAHIGAIKALKEQGLEPDIVAGTSAGALVGALYAKGLSITEMLSFFKETPLFKYDFFTISKPGLFDTEKYTDLLKSYLGEDDFSTLTKKLIVITTSLKEGKAVAFSSGNLFKPLLASAALPPIFSPVTINGEPYVDGGLVNNFPVDELLKYSSLIIGSYVSQIKNTTEVKNAWQLSQRANQIMIHSLAEKKLHIPDILFQPSGLEKIGFLDKKGIDKAFEIGYEHATLVLNQWLPKNKQVI